MAVVPLVALAMTACTSGKVEHDVSRATPGPVVPSAPATSTPAVAGPPAKLSIGSWTTGKQASLPGRLFHLTGASMGGDATVSLHLLANGALRTATIDGDYGDTDCVRPRTSSPPTAVGRRVEGDNSTLAGGALVVIAAERTQIVNLAIGVLAPAPPAWSGYLDWSANGKYVAHNEGGKIVVAEPTGAVRVRVPLDIDCYTGGFSVQCLADAGRYVGVSFRSSDPSVVRNATLIVDMNTGKAVTAAKSAEVVIRGVDRLVASRPSRGRSGSSSTTRQRATLGESPGPGAADCRLRHTP